ncbi:MAG: hypothetical protein HRT67_09605 [Flavobacteriaceae bacterium]|nr:hypothetical protein [Flavobacteriaceae bacterium]
MIKKLKQLSVVFSIIFFVTSCGGDDDSSNSSADIQLDIDGVTYQLDAFAAVLSNGGRFLAITGTNSSGDQIEIRLGSFFNDDADLLTEQSYAVEGESTVFYGFDLINNPQTTEILAIIESTNGTISITNLDTDSNRVSGTFSGTAIDGLGTTFTIANGVFNNIEYTFHD